MQEGEEQLDSCRKNGNPLQLPLLKVLPEACSCGRNQWKWDNALRMLHFSMHKPFHIPNSMDFCFHFLHGAFGISVEVGTRYRCLHPQAVLLPIETSRHDDQMPCSVVKYVLLGRPKPLNSWLDGLLLPAFVGSVVLGQIIKSHFKPFGCLTHIAQNHNTRKETHLGPPHVTPPTLFA